MSGIRDCTDVKLRPRLTGMIGLNDDWFGEKEMRPGWGERRIGMALSLINSWCGCGGVSGSRSRCGSGLGSTSTSVHCFVCEDGWVDQVFVMWGEFREVMISMLSISSGLGMYCCCGVVFICSGKL